MELKKKDSRQDMSDFPMKNGQKKNGVHPVTSPGTNVIKQYRGKLLKLRQSGQQASKIAKKPARLSCSQSFSLADRLTD